MGLAQGKSCGPLAYINTSGGEGGVPLTLGQIRVGGWWGGGCPPYVGPNTSGGGGGGGGGPHCNRPICL